CHHRDLPSFPTRRSSDLQVTLKQVLVGLGNGVINGFVGALVVGIYTRNLWLGAVLAISMIINMLVAALAGTLIPVALKRLNVDRSEEHTSELQSQSNLVC